MKKLLFLIVLLSVIWPAKAFDIYRVTAARLNVRMAPSATSPILGVVRNGEMVNVIDINHAGWAKIEYQNKEAFVSSDYLRFEKYGPQVVAETVQEEVPVETPVADYQQVKVEYQEPTTNYIDISDTPTLLNGPLRINPNFNLSYGLSAGVGFSSFLCNDAHVNGRISYTADLFAELTFNKKIAFIPKNFLTEIQLGYAGKGAAWYNLDYIHLRVYPFGYRMPIKPINMIGKVGLTIGFPLNDMESYKYWQNWGSLIQFEISAALGAEFKNFGLYANFEYGLTEVARTPTKLNNLAIYGVIAYKFGRLKH